MVCGIWPVSRWFRRCVQLLAVQKQCGKCPASTGDLFCFFVTLHLVTKQEWSVKEVFFQWKLHQPQAPWCGHFLVFALGRVRNTRRLWSSPTSIPCLIVQHLIYWPGPKVAELERAHSRPCGKIKIWFWHQSRPPLRSSHFKRKKKKLGPPAPCCKSSYCLTRSKWGGSAGQIAI